MAVISPEIVHHDGDVGAALVVEVAAVVGCTPETSCQMVVVSHLE